MCVDALTGQSVFDASPTEPLAIAGELQHWLLNDMATNNIPTDNIVSAKLVARIDLTKANWKKRTSKDHWFDRKGAEIVWRQLNRCVIECRSRIETDEAEYISQFTDVEEWPEGFPDT